MNRTTRTFVVLCRPVRVYPCPWCPGTHLIHTAIRGQWRIARYRCPVAGRAIFYASPFETGAMDAAELMD